MSDQQIPSDELCDTCRQHRAIVRFMDTHLGSCRNRQVCVSCYAGYRAAVDVMRRGKCERCGKPAFNMRGIPGPDRHFLCVECSFATTLEKIGPEGVTAVLKKLLKNNNKNWLVRCGVKVFEKMGPKAAWAIPALKELLHDEDEAVRRSAAEALKQIDPESK